MKPSIVWLARRWSRVSRGRSEVGLVDCEMWLVYRLSYLNAKTTETNLQLFWYLESRPATFEHFHLCPS